jgi:glycosyltransferase involved in cell wall biosynthesis
MMRPHRQLGKLAQYPLRWAPTVDRIARIIRERKITVVYNNTIDALYAPFAAARLKIPCVWHIHEVRPDARLARMILASLMRRLATRAVFNSRSTLVAFAGDRVPPPWSVVHNGVDLPAAQGRPLRPDGVMVVGWAGDMRPHKRPELFLKSFALARQQVSGLRAVVDGDGLLLESARRTAADLGIAQAVTFEGRVPDIAQFYAVADIVVSTSEREGFGLVIAGGMAAGLPVVAPNVGGVPELIENEVTGFLVRGDDPRAYADRIVALATDASLRARIGAAARDRVANHFTIDRYRDEMVRLLEDAERVPQQS